MLTVLGEIALAVSAIHKHVFLLRCLVYVGAATIMGNARLCYIVSIIHGILCSIDVRITLLLIVW